MDPTVGQEDEEATCTMLENLFLLFLSYLSKHVFRIPRHYMSFWFFIY